MLRASRLERNVKVPAPPQSDDVTGELSGQLGRGKRHQRRSVRHVAAP
jgi:hypothetical protein